MRIFFSSLLALSCGIIVVLFFGVTCTLKAALGQPTLTRGPYLQKVSPQSIVIRWRTDVATDSIVRYGDAASHLSSVASLSDNTTEHRVEISGLSSATTYFYTVGSSGVELVEPSKNLFFKTHPSSGTAMPTRIWVVGDSGRGNEGQRTVREGYVTFASQSRLADLWLLLGDNAYDDGADVEYQQRFFDVYKEILKNTPVWPTFGNHDGHSASSATLQGPYYSIFSLPRHAEAGGTESGTEAYYSFDYGDIHFVCLNSEDVDRSQGGDMATWLKSDLAATTKRWRIAYWHHPPYSKGSHDSDSEVGLVEMRENIVPILEDGGIDLVLSGHSHSYERSFFINGHYGGSTSLAAEMLVSRKSGDLNKAEQYSKPTLSTPHRGTVYVVAGNSSLTSGGSLDHPVMYTSELQLGSLIIDIESQDMTVQLIKPDGKVGDHFTIRKECAVDGACPTNKQFFPSTEKTIRGRRSGDLARIREVDKRSERIRFARTLRRSSNRGLLHVWGFSLPRGTVATELLATLGLRHRRHGRFEVSVSVDGSEYTLLRNVTLTSQSYKTLAIQLQNPLTSDISIRVQTRRKNIEGDLLVDFLALTGR